jgi:hypothetical protein
LYPAKNKNRRLLALSRSEANRADGQRVSGALHIPRNPLELASVRLPSAATFPAKLRPRTSTAAPNVATAIGVLPHFIEIQKLHDLLGNNVDILHYYSDGRHRSAGEER